ncbi:MAG: excinuclease ABC subunit UvrC [Planctomycetota bacterium]
MHPSIADKVARFPDGPGVYVFSDAAGKALYVGKAARLRTRVRAYLKPGGDGRLNMRFLERQARDVEFLATRTEQEALLLENTIIKKRKPPYNIRLKDDKAFLMLRLDRREPWPWFRLVRRRRDDGADYLGPFASAKSVRQTLRLLHKVVPLRDCTDSVFHNRSRPCIKHQIGRCPAPCVDLIERHDYEVLLDRAVQVLQGKVGPLLRELRDDMEAAAQALEFERAQARKVQIEALCRVAEQQTVVDGTGQDEDAVGVHRVGDEACAVFLLFRDGLLESSRRFNFRTQLPDELVLAELLGRFYEGDQYVPQSLLVPGEVAESEIVRRWLESKRGTRVELLTPQRGAKRRRLEMAADNARLADALEADETRRRAAGAAILADILNMPEPPRRLHCLDVSTIQGTSTVASRVCFVDGQPHKDGYRRFRIRGDDAGNDFDAMDQAVRRSLTRCLTTEHDELPDVLLVDGGRGQLTATCRAIEELGLTDDLVVAGLAKSRLRGVGDRRQRSAERLFVTDAEDPVPLRDGAPETLRVARARDEAHRFAITYHRKVRGRLASKLDEIDGIGPSRRRTLLRHFGSLSAVRQASLTDLCDVPGLPRAVAEQVFQQLHGDK